MASSKQQKSQGQSGQSAAKQTRGVPRPDEVRVLTITYTIQWLSEDEWYAARLDSDAIGVTERDKALISLRADETANEDSLRATLLHEMLHTLTESSRVAKFASEVEDLEEFMVATMSPILLHVLNDNPGVVAYLLSVGESA